MADEDYSPAPDLWQNIDDISPEHNQYCQPARRQLPKNRREWSGVYLQQSTSNPDLLSGEEGAQAEAAASSQKMASPTKPSARGPDLLSGPQSAAAQATTTPKQPAKQKNKNAAATSGPQEPATADTTATAPESGPQEPATADATTSQAAEHSAAGSDLLSEPVSAAVPPAQQQQAAPASEVQPFPRSKSLLSTAPKKIELKLLPRHPAAVQQQEQPTSSAPIAELASAQDLRDGLALIAAVKQKYREWLMQRPSELHPLAFTKEWYDHEYGSVLHAEYLRLLPQVRQREQADMVASGCSTQYTRPRIVCTKVNQPPPAADARQITATTAGTSELPPTAARPSEGKAEAPNSGQANPSQLPPAAAPQSIEEPQNTIAAIISDQLPPVAGPGASEEQHLDAWAEQNLPRPPRTPNMSLADVQQAYALVFDEEHEQLDYEEEMPPAAAPSTPKPPQADEFTLDELLRPPRTAPSRATTPGPYCNPYAPSTPRDPRPAADQHAAVQAGIQQWLHSGAPPRRIQPTARDASRSRSASRETNQSGQQPGSKRASRASSSAAPARKRRENSSSPVRDKSPGVERKIQLRAKAKAPPIPLIDGFVTKDIAVFNRRQGQHSNTGRWAELFETPNGDFLFIGAINHIGIPRVYLPDDKFAHVPSSADLPLADETREEFDAEETAIPKKFILAHTVGAYPAYHEMVTRQTREYLFERLKPDEKYLAMLRIGGAGPTGYNLRGTTANNFEAVLDAQRIALIRFGRVARKSGRCLVIMLEFDNVPEGFDAHADAIYQLKEVAKLDREHPIHLVLYRATVLDFVKWLQTFPNTIIGLGLQPLAEFAFILDQEATKKPELLSGADLKTYQTAEAWRTMLRSIPLRNVAIQSGCPMLIEGSQAGCHHSPAELLNFGGIYEKLTGEKGDALYVHSAHNLRRSYGLNQELLTHTSGATDRRPGRLTRTGFIDDMLHRYGPPAARADPADQSASPMAVEEGGAVEAQPQKQKPRSQSTAARRPPSPTKSRDERGRSRDKRDRISSKPVLLTGADQAGSSKAAQQSDKDYRRSSSKPVLLTGKEPSQKHSRVEKKEHTSRDRHRSKDKRHRSPTPTKARSAARDSRSHSRRDRSPADHRRRDSKDDSRSTAKSPPALKYPDRRRVELSPSTDEENRSDLRVTVKPTPKQDKPKTTGKESTELRIFVPQNQPVDASELRIVVPQNTYYDFKRPAAPAATKQQRQPARVSVRERISLIAPRGQNRQRGGVPALLAGTSTAATISANMTKLLKEQPVLSSVKPLPTSMNELLDLLQPHFYEEQNGDEKKIKVDPDSLATYELHRAQPDVIQITHGCDLPFDALHVCRGNVAQGHIHLTIEQAKLIGDKRRWSTSGGIQDDEHLKNMLTDVFAMRINTFAQMILLKYASRHRTNDPRAPHILRFINRMLRATDLETSLPQLLTEFLPRMTFPQTRRPFPDEIDFKRAAEAWLCYCEEAFHFIFERLNGPATWNTDWLQSNGTHEGIRQSIVDRMINMAQKNFDEIRHQLFLQYGRPHIDAVLNQKQFSWDRFDDMDGKRIDIDPEDELSEQTVCFIDEVTLEMYGEATLDSVRLILVPHGDAEAIFAFVHRFYPLGTVERVVLWFGNRFIAAGHQDYRDLVAELCHHFAIYFGRLQQYVVLPPYARDYADVWSGGPLATFAQRADVVPYARVIIDPYDLYLWYCDVSGLDKPLPGFIDGAGRLLTPEIVLIRKLRMARVHDFDLWMRDEFYNPPPKEEESVLLTDAPTTSTDQPSTSAAAGQPSTSAAANQPGTSATAYDDEFFRNNPGFEKIATYVAQKLHGPTTQRVVAKITAAEKAVALFEQQNADGEDSDVLSEGEPDKDNEMEQ